MKFYKIETQSGEELITNIKEEDVIETVFQSDLKEIDAKTVLKYNLKAGMKVVDVLSIEDEDGDNADIVANANFASCYVEDYIKIDELKDDCLYTDSYTDELYTASHIETWDKDEYIFDHDGSNWRITKIIESFEIEVEEIESENYDTGRVETYKTPKGNLVRVDYSMYQGTWDNVFEGEEFIEEEGK